MAKMKTEQLNQLLLFEDVMTNRNILIFFFILINYCFLIKTNLIKNVKREDLFKDLQYVKDEQMKTRKDFRNYSNFSLI